MQVILTMLLFVAIIVVRDIVPCVSRFVTSHRVRQSDQAQHRPKTVNHLATLVAAAVELQRVQCYYMFAVQIAVARTVITDPNSLGSSSRQQTANTLNVLQGLCYGGSLPTTFMLYQLILMRHVSWELLLLTVVTLVFCMVTAFYATNINFFFENAGTQALIQARTFPSCGSVNPTAFCFKITNDAKALHNYRGLNYRSAPIFGLAIVVVIFYAYIYIYTVEQRRQYSPDKQQMLDSFVRKIVLIIVNVLFHAYYLALFAAYLSALSSFANPFREKATAAKQWTFGQIIAVVVFLPPMISYLTFTIRKCSFVFYIQILPIMDRD